MIVPIASDCTPIRDLVSTVPKRIENTVKILKFRTLQTIAIIVLKIEKFDVTLH